MSEAAHDYPSSDGITVAELDTEDRLVSAFYHDFREGRLSIPSLPDVVVRISKALRDPDVDVATVAKLLQSDPALSGRIVQIANSPLYRGARQIERVQDAVSRLGLNATRNLVTSVVLKQTFQSKSPLIGRWMRAIWAQSTKVAAISAVLGRITPGMASDETMLAGLLHRIGSIPILTYAEKYPELVENPPRLNRLLEAMQPEVGAMVLQRWKFSPEIVTTARECSRWRRDPSPDADYCDVVMIAQLHSFVGTKRIAQLPPMDSVPAFQKLALGLLGPDLSLQVLKDAHHEIEEVQRLLAG
ncbi:MAG: HDOD domain-containing protein [Chromatiales bacterium]|nr:HDOD domain-containing protein [Chromatiales bacterium]